MNKMVKLFSVVMVLAMLVGSVTVLPAAAASQLANGDFSDELNGWSGTKNNAEIMTEDNEKFMGIYTYNANVESLLVEVEAGKPYVWTFDVRSAEQSRVWVKWFNEEATYLTDNYRLEFYIPASSTWSETSVVGTAPDDAAFVTIFFNKCTNSSDTVCIDNVALQPLTEQSGELLAGGDLNADSIPANIKAGDAEVVSDTQAHGGIGKALKLETTEAGTKTVSAYCYATAGQKIDASVYMNLTELTEDSSGVMLEVWNASTTLGATLLGTTSYFKVVENSAGNALGWRKMMVPLGGLAKATKLELRVTFTGQGTVYLDDFSAVTAPENEIIRNGDFEGLTGDFNPAWWGQNLTAETGNKYIATENTGNTYFGLNKTTNDTVAFSKDFSLSVGTRYKLTFDYKNSGDLECAEYRLGDSTSKFFYLNKAEEWTKHTYYMTATTSSSTNGMHSLYLRAHWKDVTACFDNFSITVENTPDSIAFYDKDGKETETLTAGETFTAKYTGFGTDYTDAENNRKVRMMLAKYKKVGNSVILEDIVIKNGSAQKIEGTKYSGCYSAHDAVTGEVPLELTASVTAEEGCVYKALAWEEGNVLKPLTAAAELK